MFLSYLSHYVMSVYILKPVGMVFTRNCVYKIEFHHNEMAHNALFVCLVKSENTEKFLSETVDIVHHPAGSSHQRIGTWLPS